MQFKHHPLGVLGVACGALLCCAPLASAQEKPAAPAQTSGSFFSPVVDEARWNVLTRTVYERRDYLNGAKSNGGRNAYLRRSERSDYAEEWGLGVMGSLETGYTRGPVGFGIDAFLFGGLNLMGDDYRVGKIRLLPVDKNGYAQDSMLRGGVALKAKISKTMIRFGEQRVKTPIFSSSDSRLLPESMRGLYLNSKEFSTLKLHAGRFTDSTDRNSRDSNNGLTVNYLNPAFQRGEHFDLAGLTWSGVPGLSLSAFAGRLTDTWVSGYLGAFYGMTLADKSKLSFDTHLYTSRDTGKAYAGDIRNTTGSILASYQTGAHKLGLGYQKVAGDTPFDYVTRGAIWLGNGMMLSDFNAPHEQSWQVRYELDGTAFSLPGASLGVAYARGSGIDGTRMPANSGYAWLGYGKDGKHWERDIWFRYTVPSGAAKGLALLLRYGVHRANDAQAELDTDQIRLSVEFPFGSK